MELKQGLFSISPKIYHSMPGLSYTGIKDFQRSAAYYLASLSGQREETPAMKFGSAYHAFLLENKIFKDEFCVAPSDRRSKQYREFEAEHQGLEIITQADMDKIHKMADVLWAHPQWKIFSPQSLREIAMVWHEDDLDIWCRTRIDLLNPSLRVPVDLKTTGDARPLPFLQSAFRLGYQIQAAWTLRGLQKVTGDRHETFVFIVQEKEEPYQVAVYEATPAFIEHGNREINELLPIYAECMHTGIWPGYDPAIKALDLPPWIVANTAETENMEEDNEYPF